MRYKFFNFCLILSTFLWIIVSTKVYVHTAPSSEYVNSVFLYASLQTWGLAQWYKIRKKVQNYQMLIAKDPKTNNFHHKILGFLSLFAKQSSFWISQNPSSKFLIQNSILDFWSSSQEFILVYFMQMNQNTPIIY